MPTANHPIAASVRHRIRMVPIHPGQAAGLVAARIGWAQLRLSAMGRWHEAALQSPAIVLQPLAAGTLGARLAVTMLRQRVALVTQAVGAAQLLHPPQQPPGTRAACQQLIVVVGVVDVARTVIDGVEEADVLAAKVVPRQMVEDAVAELALIRRGEVDEPPLSARVEGAHVLV